MATIKAYTDLQQSKKLTEILPLESVDMYYDRYGDPYFINVSVTHERIKNDKYQHLIPCWSLASLLNIIPTMIGSVFEKDALRLRIDKSETNFNIWYDNLDTGMVEEGFDVIKTNPVDACVEMIIRLNELKML